MYLAMQASKIKLLKMKVATVPWLEKVVWHKLHKNNYFEIVYIWQTHFKYDDII